MIEPLQEKSCRDRSSRTNESDRRTGTKPSVEEERSTAGAVTRAHCNRADRKSSTRGYYHKRCGSTRKRDTRGANQAHIVRSKRVETRRRSRNSKKYSSTTKRSNKVIFGYLSLHISKELYTKFQAKRSNTDRVTATGTVTGSTIVNNKIVNSKY